MRARPHRLSGRRQFEHVRKGRIRTQHGVVSVAVGVNGLDRSRVGFAIRGVRSAVVRNRLRRRLRAGVVPVMERGRGVDIVVSAGSEAAAAPFQLLATDLRSACDAALMRIDG